jgi:ATP-dependent helicase HrpA
MHSGWSELKQSLRDTMISDTHRLRRRLQELEKMASSGKDVGAALEKWQQQMAASRARLSARQAAVSEKIEFPALPISDKREEIAELISRHQVVVLAGETGSGKTTQIPKICLSLGRGVRGMIGHTQPRRIAAHTVAARVAEELHSPLGELVGVQVRFSDQTGDNTLIKLMTDGILLAEIQQDPFLNRYDTLIIDEAHERSLNIDFLLGYLKHLLPRRPDLKVIITSATIDLEKFSAHFNQAPIIEVSGRTYPVDVWYRPLLDLRSEDTETEPDINLAIVEAVHEIEAWEKSGKGPRGGDILVFLSGEREIREAADALRKAQFAHMEVLPFYARLSLAEQQKVFAPHRGRRIVLATNVAETSITVPGIRYVIDPGYARISRYSYRTKVQRLPVEPVSQASANQRKGRCGRVSDGICIRLYSEEDFQARSAYTDAEILRTNLAAVILQMLQLRIGDIHQFPFIDSPDPRLINDGFKLLEELNAVDKQQRITPLGRELHSLAVDPRLARMLLAAGKTGCLREILIIVSALSVQDCRERPLEKQQAADQMHRRFWAEESDFLALVKLWDYLEEQRQALSQNQLRKLCKKEFISYLRYREWRDIHHQLRLSLRQLSLRENTEPSSYDTIHQALLTGLLGNLGFNVEGREYLGARNRRFAIFPGSSLAKKTPKWIMAAELLETSKLYAHHVARIEPEWALEAAQHLVKRQVFEPHYDSRSGQVMAYEKVSLYGLTLIERQKVSYSRVNPQECREIFIRAALVEGQYGQHPKRKHAKGKQDDFFAHQQNLLAELDELESKARRRDLLADEQVLFDFYDERIPQDVINLAGFEAWRKKVEQQQPKLLFIDRERLMRHSASDITQAQFPNELHWRDLVFPLSYHFEPGHAADGVSIHVPLSLLHQVPEQRLEWLVPGMLRDKCISLIKNLPKSLRKHFVPVPDVVDRVLAQLVPDNVSLIDSLAHQFKRLSGVSIGADDWQPQLLDDFYRMNIYVLDEQGKKVDQGRDLAALRDRYRTQVQARIQSAATNIERDNITRWDFGRLETSVNLSRGGIQIRAYPALVDKNTHLALQVLDDPVRAREQTRRGLARLLGLESPALIKYLQKELFKGQELALSVAGLGKREAVVDDVILASWRHLCLAQEQAFPQDRAEFEALLALGNRQLVATAQTLAQDLGKSFELLVEVRKQLKQQRNALALAYCLSDIDVQLKGLFYPGFVYQTPPQWLAQYPRYLRALQQRLEKALLNPQKDRLQLQEVQGHWQRLQEFLQSRGEGSETLLMSHPALSDYRWWIEELRVSLFAQTLKTQVSISSKRLDKQWQDALESVKNG